MRTSALRGCAALLGCALGVVSAAAPAAHAPELARLTEYEVKAGFLYNFAKLVEWPHATPATLSLCFVGDDPFGNARHAIEGKAVGARTLVVRAVALSAELRACQIVYVPPSHSARLKAVLGHIGDAATLTVGDGEGLATQGFVASFYREGDKIRFEINVDAAYRARLRISSRLLQLARIVHDPEATR